MSSEAVAPPQPEKAVPQRVFRLPREIGILGALGLMLLVLAIFIPQFRDLQNITNITRNFSFVGIVAMGMTLVILTGGIDLSVGSVWGMTADVVAYLLFCSPRGRNRLSINDVRFWGLSRRFSAFG
jgi:ribose transport system permease protein